MHKEQSTKTSNNILYIQCLSEQLRKASVLLCLTVDKTSQIHNSQHYTLHEGQGPRPSVTTIKKKKILIQCCLLAVVHLELQFASMNICSAESAINVE